ncbi:MAG: AsnC family transcriptional regulator [Thermoprotei archaeon]|nr:MAG: AsnC family transcriptional regulator [Thermoprotei archaeon]
MQLTEKQIALLKYLLDKSQPLKVYTVYISQEELAHELGITRQALSTHLRKLKDLGLIRTGREFIDVTERALEVLGLKASDAFVLIKVEPKARGQVYGRLLTFPVEKIYRVTGDIDLIAVLRQSHLNEFLKQISKLEGIISTSTHIVIEELK